MMLAELSLIVIHEMNYVIRQPLNSLSFPWRYWSQLPVTIEFWSTTPRFLLLISVMPWWHIRKAGYKAISWGVSLSCHEGVACLSCRRGDGCAKILL